MKKNISLLKRVIDSSYTQYIIVVLSLTPLFFINIKSTHDWGDDFAMYISQAKCIIEGRPQIDNGFIYNKNNPELSPAVFNGGYPLLLCPVIAIYGVNFVALNYYQTFWLICFGFVSFLFLKFFFRFIYCITTVILICFSPFMLSFKSEIMCDIPFSVFFILGLFLYLKNKSY